MLKYKYESKIVFIINKAVLTSPCVYYQDVITD